MQEIFVQRKLVQKVFNFYTAPCILSWVAVRSDCNQSWVALPAASLSLFCSSPSFTPAYNNGNDKDWYHEASLHKRLSSSLRAF